MHPGVLSDVEGLEVEDEEMEEVEEEDDLDGGDGAEDVLFDVRNT